MCPIWYNGTKKVKTNSAKKKKEIMNFTFKIIIIKILILINDRNVLKNSEKCKHLDKIPQIVSWSLKWIASKNRFDEKLPECWLFVLSIPNVYWLIDFIFSVLSLLEIIIKNLLSVMSLFNSFIDHLPINNSLLILRKLQWSYRYIRSLIFGSGSFFNIF